MMTALKKNYVFLLLPILTLSFFSGCATTPRPQKNEKAVFYPPPPELPRLQYLHSFTGAKDIEPGPSAFDSFVTGVKKSDQRLLKPYGVAMYDGKIYVCDTNYSVMVFDLKQKTYSRLKGAQGLGKLLQPINISIDQDGTKYVADPIRGQVVAFDRDDSYMQAYGMGSTWRPVDAVAFGDLLYVVDAKNAQIKVFDKKTGETVKTIGKSGKPEERLGIPTNLAIDKNGTLYVSDAAKFQIVMYDRDGHYLGKIGGPGQEPGCFARPRGVEVDNSGRVYAVDAAFDNVQIFNKKGNLLLFFSGPGREPGDLFLPAKVFIDYDQNDIKQFSKYARPDFKIENLVLVTSQFGDRLINVYGFGKEKGKNYPTEEKLRQDAIKRLQKWLKENPPKEDHKEELKKNS